MELLKNENDFYTSVEKSLTEIDPKWWEYKGLIVCGTHKPESVEEKLTRIKWNRENNIPSLGLCMGMQLMVIEYARNVLKMTDANSVEIDPNTTAPVIKKLPELRVGLKYVDGRLESHWHNYAFNNIYMEFFQDWQLTYTDQVLEEMRLKTHPYFLGVQYHPEYQSSKDNPHLILLNFINECKKYG